MAQVLKEEIRQRIFQAAEEEFYDKDYRRATMKDIALRAQVPVGLIYSYYRNKEMLFEEVVRTVFVDIQRAIAAEEQEMHGQGRILPQPELEPLLGLLAEHRKLVILIDKSQGSTQEKAREKMVEMLETHIGKSFLQFAVKEYDPMLVHILAGNFVESLLEIARHFRGIKWAESVLQSVVQAYFAGVNSLLVSPKEPV